MIGLGVLYAEKASKEKGWEKIRDREKAKRLREVYWVEHAKGLLQEKKSFLEMNLDCRIDHEEIGRKIDDPGDDFIYKMKIATGTESGLEWVEVTEVFTTAPPEKIEGAMKVLNGIESNRTVDLEEFLKGLRRGIPSRAQQRAAADKVMAVIEKKIRKTSYDEVVEKYGYGTLVVGLPLWFAAPPADPFRAENSLDNFMVRTAMGIEEIRQKELIKKECPFKRVIVLWETTPEAMKEWGVKRSREYEDAANTTLMNPISLTALLRWLELLEKPIERTGTVKSEVSSSLHFHIEKKVERKKEGKGPYTDIVLKMEKIAKQLKKEERKKGIIEKFRFWFFLQLFKVFCFARIHGIAGLAIWGAQKISPKRYLRNKAAEQRALWLYRESVRRTEYRKERKRLQDLGFNPDWNLE